MMSYIEDIDLLLFLLLNRVIFNFNFNSNSRGHKEEAVGLAPSRKSDSFEVAGSVFLLSPDLLATAKCTKDSTMPSRLW